MKKLSVLFLTLAAAVASWASDNYTVIVSCDGLRWDYAECYDMPFFDRLAREGVKAVMQPSYPTKTFPNHYTLATGLYPDHHGLIGNTFRILGSGKTYSLSNKETRGDGRNYGGEPIWITAKRQGVKTATVYWVGSDVKIQGEHPDYWHDYQKKPLLTYDERVKRVVELLQMPLDKRPKLVMCYFDEPDHTGHNYGPNSKKTRRAIESLDSVLWSMWVQLKALPDIGDRVNLIILGDHGMAWQSQLRTVNPKEYLKEEWIAQQAGDDPALIYVNRPEYADSVVNALAGVDHIRVFKKGEMPEALHYGTNVNMGDVIVVPDLGWLFTSSNRIIAGGHGWDNTASDMQVGFRAIGPDFKTGYVRPGTFRNVCIYPLLAHLLGINPSPNDGDLNEIGDILRIAPPRF